MELTDEQLKALGLDMPPPDVAMQPSAPPSIISQAPPAPQAPRSIMGDKIPAGAPIPTSHDQGKEEFKQYMPQITSAPGTTDYFRQRQEQLDYKSQHPWGDPISAHPGILGKIGHVAAKVGNIAGDIVAPGTMALIPGTDLHNSILGAQNERGIQAGEAAQNQETETAAKKTTADADKEKADAAKEVADQGGKPTKPEPIFDKNGAIVGFNTGTDLIGMNNPNLTPDMKAIATAAKPKEKTDKPDTPEQQFLNEFQKAHPDGKIADAVAAYAQATQKPDKPQRQLAVIDGKVVELKPGMDATGAESIGGSEKAGVAGEAGKDALNYANDYLKEAKFTAAGDEALMEKYFELAKPSSGFRMSQPQIEMLQKGRDLMGGFEAKAKHLFTPEAPYFSDEQRKQIVETMSRIESSKGEHGKSKTTTADPLGIR